MQLKAIETNKGAESHIAGLYASYDLPHSNRIKVKKTTANTDQTSYVTLEIECDAL